MRKQSADAMCKASDRLIGKGSDLLAKAERQAGEAVDHLKQYADENPPQADVSSAEAWVVSATAKIAAAHAEADKVFGKMNPSKRDQFPRSFATRVGDSVYAVAESSGMNKDPGESMDGSRLYFTGYHNSRGPSVGAGVWILHGRSKYATDKMTTSVWMRKA